VRDAIVPLAILLALGLALRLIIAYVLLPGSGFKVDLGSFSGWAMELARNGPWGLYGRDIFVDYTPGYLYVLWGLGLVAQGTGIDVGQLLKLPAIAADLALAVAIFALAAELGAGRRGALAAAAVFLFVPVTWFDNAVWAQVDSVGTLFLVLAVRELWRGKSERAAILTTIAAIIKPQFGILIPLAAVVIIRRHWVERPDDGSRLGGGPIRILTTTLAGLVTATLVCLPFGLAIVPIPGLVGFEDSLLGQIVQTAGGYPYVTVNAYNPWALVSLDGSGLAASGTWIRDAPNPGVPGDPYYTVLGAPAVLAGSLILGAAIAALMVVLWRRHDDRRALLVALAVMAVAFFVLPTRVHERYLYPFFALGAILIALRPRWAAVYGVLAAANFANLYGVLTLPFYESPGLGPMLDAFGGLGARLGEAVRSQAGVTAAAAAHAGGFLAAAAFLARPVGGETDRELAEDGPEDVAEEAPGGEPALAEAPPGAAGAAAVALAPAAAPPPSPASSPHPGAALPTEPSAGLLAAALPRADEEGAPFDRSPALAREGGGRFDRLDLWLLVVLVVATLCLRTFRLGEPMRMHFDEVYHARTAMEFLQHWRYGEPHGIYEFTHPHLAKYGMAAGIVLFGNDRVVAESDLGTPVRDAVIEPGWDEPSGAEVPGAPARGGARLYVATGDRLDVYDLRTRERLASFPVPGAQAVAVDADARQAYVGTANGSILALDTAVSADELRGSSGADLEALAPIPFAEADADGGAGERVERLWTAGSGDYVLAGLPGGGLATFDAATGDELSRLTLPGLAEVVDAGRVSALVARPAEVPDPAATAAEVARLVGGDPAAYRELLAGDAPEVVLTSDLAGGREAVDQAVGEGALPGLRIREVPRVAAATAAGVAFLEPATGRETGSVPLGTPATGLVEVTGIDEPALYAASGSALAVVKIPNGDAAASLDRTVWMPGPLERVAYNPASQLVHALGRTPDGTSATIYVVEPRGSSVFADAVLPFAPVAWAPDTDAAHPSVDRQELLAFSADGAGAAVDIGQNAFAWRIPGVVLGALMAGLVFLLARILFRRRSIAVLAGLLVLADGMLFAQSRIAMNDAYVAFFIVAAVTLFAAIWSGAWRWRGAFWAGLPLVGVLLGLALASKWVALYAIGGIGLLVLLRSALGRALIVLGLAAITGGLGYIAIATGPDTTSDGNVLFLLLMVALTLVAAAVAVLHPVAWTVEEVRIAVAGPAAAGILVGLAAIPLGLGSAAIAAAAGLMALGGLAAGAFWAAARLGFGPLAPPPAVDDPAALLEPAAPAPTGWLRPGWLAGIPIAWAAVSLLAIPIAVYVVAYLPWAALGNQIVAGWPGGHDGQTLADLTRSMYEYHNNLRATHAASSPWWAWPANLKPVWFYQDSFAGPTVGAIYDSGNLVTWWLSIPAFAFVAWQAFRRRSLPLAFVAITFAALWLPWARIDRATFQYHYYTALPFVLLALAYFAAELWHGPSRRTWLLARGAAAGALLAPVAMWLFRGPLCVLIDVERANPGSQACSSAASLSISFSAQLLGLLAVLGVAGVLLVWQLLALDRAARTEEGRSTVGGRLVRLAATAAAGLAGLLVAWAVLPADPLAVYPNVPGEALALSLLVVLGPLAYVAWGAASPRRFVVGLVLAAAFTFVLFYPNISGLPLPNAAFNWYQGLLPTWLYPFQFPVNTDPAVTVSLLGPWPLTLFAAILLAAVLVGYSAWAWRLALAERVAAASAEP
jgi:4-amino-4-deoxy-L-arabinose transferase-like glycosyltransferase